MANLSGALFSLKPPCPVARADPKTGRGVACLLQRPTAACQHVQHDRLPSVISQTDRQLGDICLSLLMFFSFCFFSSSHGRPLLCSRLSFFFFLLLVLCNNMSSLFWDSLMLPQQHECLYVMGDLILMSSPLPLWCFQWGLHPTLVSDPAPPAPTLRVTAPWRPRNTLQTQTETRQRARSPQTPGRRQTKTLF